MVLRMANPSKHPKTGVYDPPHARAARRSAAVGSALIKINLETKDPDEARLKHSTNLAELQTQWAQLRKGVQHLGDNQLEALAGEFYQEILLRFPTTDRCSSLGSRFSQII